MYTLPILILFGITLLLTSKTKHRPSTRPQPIRDVPTPEPRIVIRVTDQLITYSPDDDTVQQMEWDDLQQVIIHTSVFGPLYPQVSIELIGTLSVIDVHAGVRGLNELGDKLWSLPGADTEAYKLAMNSMDSHRVVFWERTSPM